MIKVPRRFIWQPFCFLLREQRLIWLENLSDNVSNSSENHLQNQLNLIESQAKSRLINLVQKNLEQDANGRPKEKQYTDLQEILIILKYLPSGKKYDTTAILNTASQLSNDMGASYQDLPSLFRRLWSYLDIDENTLAEAELTQNMKDRMDALKKSLAHNASTKLRDKVRTLTKEEIKNILNNLYDTVTSEKNFNGLKVGGYKKNKQALLIQQVLFTLGYYKGKPDGIYGPQTRLAVKKLQADLKITEDGGFGNTTFLSVRNLLEYTLAEKELQSGEPQVARKIAPSPPMAPSVAIEAPKSHIPPPDAGGDPMAEQYSERLARIREKFLLRKELDKTFHDFLEEVKRVHGLEIAADIVSLRKDHIDLRDSPDGSQHEAKLPDGERGRIFYKSHGEVYFSVIPEMVTALSSNRLYQKLGDSKSLYISPRENGGIVSVIPTNISDIFFSNTNDQIRLFDKGGNNATLQDNKFEFKDGPFEGKRYRLKAVEPGNVEIIEA